VLIPLPPPPDPVTVTMPADKADTLKLAPKSIDDAVPTRVPSSLIMTPPPGRLVNPDPSPTKCCC
jgi:hypothetical protein